MTIKRWCRRLKFKSYERICKVCNGSGYTGIDFGTVVCRECDGTGKMPWTTMIKDEGGLFNNVKTRK